MSKLFKKKNSEEAAVDDQNSIETENIVRKYGLVVDHKTNVPEGWDVSCDNQLKLMNDFWNGMVAVENEFSAAYLDVRNKQPSIEPLQNEYDSLNEEYKNKCAERKKINSSNRKMTPVPASLANEIEELKTRLNAVKIKLSAAKEEFKQQKIQSREIIKHLKDNPENINWEIQPSSFAEFELRQYITKNKKMKEILEHHKSLGLWWGNYNAVDMSFKAAQNAIFKSLQHGEMASMQFHHFDGSGRLRNQIQGGMSLNDLFGGNHSQVRVDPLPPANTPFEGSKTQRQKFFTQTKLHFVVYKNYKIISVQNGNETVQEKEKDVKWITFNMVMHRPIPDDCIIKEVVVTRKKIASKFRWEVVFTCSREKTNVQNTSNGVAAINIGWRKMPSNGNSNTIRTAVYKKDNNAPEGVFVNQAIVEQFDYIEDIHSERDKAKDIIHAWIKGIDFSTAPDEFRGYAMNAQRAPKIGFGKLAKIAIIWRNHQGWNKDYFNILEEWRRDDKKLWEKESNLRDKLIARRREDYRIAAKKIVDDAHDIIMDANFLKDAIRVENDEGKKNNIPLPSRKIRQRDASPSVLVEAIKNRAQKMNCIVHTTDVIESMTWTCQNGHRVESPNKENLIQKCPVHGCGEIFDQDENNVKNKIKDFRFTKTHPGKFLFDRKEHKK